jgi:MFS family permease
MDRDTFQPAAFELSIMQHGKTGQPSQQLSAIQLTEPLTSSRSRADYTFPEGGRRAWLVVFGSFCVISGTYGLISSVGLFLSYWKENQLSNYTSSEIGWISAINVFFALMLGVQVGPLFDKHGPRYLIAGGSLVYVVSLVLLGECKKYWHFMLVYGVLNGVSAAFLTTTALAVIAHWFEVKRGLASGITFVGSSIGGIVFPLVLKPMFEHLGWAWSMRVIALVALFLMAVGNICIRGRLPPRTTGGAVDLRCLRDARFSWATLGIACKSLIPIAISRLIFIGFEFVLFGALGLLPTYATGQGFSSQTSFNIVAILNAYVFLKYLAPSIDQIRSGSAFGRSFSGYISDRYGRFNTMIMTLAWSLIVTFALWLPVGHHIVLFYIFAPLFGFGSGSIISMAPVCVGQLCQADEYGQFYGTSYCLVSFA